MSAKVLLHLVTKRELLGQDASLDRARKVGVLVVTFAEMVLELVAAVECLLAVDGWAWKLFLRLMFEHVAI